MHENCSVRSFEMCVQEVIAGNRGFCNPNPRWQGLAPGVRQTGPGESGLLTGGGALVIPAKKRRAISQSQRLSYLGAQFLPGKNERALMKIFRGKTRKIGLPHASASLI
jgi:hypothetical protein